MSFSDFKKKYNVNLNEQQEAAVQAVEGNVLLLAVPGSGKTTVLINRLGYMIFDQEVAPENILTVTYTVAATKDMRDRFEGQFGSEAAEHLEFRTINSLSQKILNYYGKIAGKKAYNIIEKKSKTGLVKNIFKTVDNAFATENDVKNIETAITYVKNMRFSLEQIEKVEVDIEKFSEIYEIYQRELRERGWIDFDDQMVYALMILEKIPGVLEYFQNQYKYICVDEAQDTSKLQHDMINLLAAKNGNLFMVGDEDQSIYGFRAAYPEALIAFEKVHPCAMILFMETNYRSNKEIVEAADKLINCNQKRHKKQMKAIKPVGGRVAKIEANSRKAQIAYLLKVAEDCKEETAVLYRNSESALPLIDMLERGEISFRMKSKEMMFFTHPIVSDISDFIRLAFNPIDKDVFLRIYYKMGIGISKDNAMRAVNYNKGNQPLIDNLEELDGISTYTRKQCRALSTHFVNMRKESAGKAVYRILNFMGYGEYMNNHGMDSEKSRILQLLANQEEQLEKFLPRLEKLKLMISKKVPNYNSKVILSTIHLSKGLEYDSVYMLDMLEGTLPSISEPKKNASPADVALYEEERRLFYVGMTRAKKSLYIFTFKESETSAFSKVVFGIESGAQNKPIVGKELQKKLLDYEQGIALIHQKFGQGAVVNRKDNYVDIYFTRTGETKKIALEYAVANGIIRLK